MNRNPIRIGIGGSHSTGKTTFLNSLEARLERSNLRIHRVRDVATNARDIGFPILTEHTFESTLWIMAEGIRREAEATLTHDIIFIDRPVFDALGYFKAAMDISGREADTREMEELRAIAFAHLGAYNLVFRTELNPTVALGNDRDTNEEFRQAAANQIKTILEEMSPSVKILTTSNVEQMLDHAMEVIETHFPSSLRGIN